MIFKKNFVMTLTLAILAIAVQVRAETTWHVDADATGPSHDGTSWCSAFLYLQDALAAAAAGDEIRIADGTYRPDQGDGQTLGDRDATFQLITGVQLYGGYGGCGAPDLNDRDFDSYETVLSGDLDDDDGHDFVFNEENSYTIVNGSGTDESTVISGLTIMGGNANGNGSEWANWRGGGMYVEEGSPTVSDCVFAFNYAIKGGGIYIWKNGSSDVSHCEFFANQAAQSGGGIFVHTSSPTVTQCYFEFNFGYCGGGISTAHSSSAIFNCTFAQNWAAFGGGLYSVEGQAFVKGCKFYGNLSASGGGMFNLEDLPTIVNCVFSGNRSLGPYIRAGGGLSNGYGSRATVLNSTFVGNTSVYGVGGLHDQDRLGTVDNCIFWNNGPTRRDQINLRGSAVNYSCIQGWLATTGGIGNLADDPLFIDPDGADDIGGTEDDDLRLVRSSPCIDAGDNDAIPPGVAVDVDGMPRCLDIPTVPDTGNPGAQGPPIVDMGGYERSQVGRDFAPIPR